MSTRFNKFPTVKMPQEFKCYSNWDQICNKIVADLKNIQKSKKVVVVELYHGVNEKEFQKEFFERISPDKTIDVNRTAMYPENRVRDMVYPDVTDDRIFWIHVKIKIRRLF